MNLRFTESCDHGNRVRRRDKTAEYQCARPLPTSQVMHSSRDGGSRQHHSGTGQSEDYWKFPPQLIPAKVKCCLEDQRWQKLSLLTTFGPLCSSDLAHLR